MPSSPAASSGSEPDFDVERFRSLLTRDAGIVLIELDARGVIVSCSGQAGATRDRHLLADLPDRERATAAERLARVLEHNEEAAFEFVLPDGGRFAAVARPSPDGGALVVGRDITEQAGALERARRAAREFHSIVAGQPGASALVDMRDGVVFLSDSVVDLLGYSPADLMGWKARSLLSSDSAGSLRAILNDASDSNRHVHTTIEVDHRDGSPRWLEFTIDRLVGEDGRPQLLATARDVTGQLQVEADLRRQRDLALALSDLGALVNSSLELGDVLGRILEAAAAVVPNDLSSIMLIHDDRAVIVAHRGLESYGIRLESDQRWMSLQGNTHVARAVRQRKPEIVTDAAADPEWTLFYGPSPIRSSLITPIIVKGKVIGLLNVDSVHRRAFAAEDADRLQAFSDHAGVALANAQLFEQISAEKDRIALLYRLQHDLDVTVGIQAIIQRVLAFADIDLHATSSELWWADELPGRFTRHQRESISGDTPTLSASWLLEQTTPLVLVSDPTQAIGDGGPTDPRWRMLAGEGSPPVAACLPLRVGERILGALVLQAKSFDFPYNDRGLLRALARALALSLESAHLLEAEHQRAEDLAALDQLSVALIDPPSVDELSQRICAAVQRQFATLTCEIDLAGPPTTEPSSRSLHPPEDLAAVAARLGTPIFVDDIRSESSSGESLWAPRPRHLDARTQGAVPLWVGGRTMGVILLERSQPGSFTERDQRLLTAFAERAASALHSTQLVAALADDARYLSTLNEISRSGLRGADLTSLLERMADLVVELIQADSAAITLWDDVTKRRQPGAGSASIRDLYRAHLAHSTERQIADLVIETGLPLVVPDVLHPTPLLPEPSRRLPAKTLLAAPLLIGERVLGALIVGYHQHHPVSSVDVERVRHAAGVVALSIANQQLFDELATARQTAETANQLKGEFLANTSHELRTPLSGILGALRLVLDDVCQDRDEERAFVNTAHDAALRLLTHINELLDLSKIEAGQMTVELQAVDVGLAMSQVYDLLAPNAAQQGVTLSIENRLAPDVRAYADPEHVRHVLLNLVGNALKFTPRGDVRLRATNGADAVFVAVEDTGIGIPAEAQHGLFQPFVQVDGSSTRPFGGTGLGLAISRKLAEGMGGTLDLFSAGLHQGSTFTLRLPLWSGDVY